MPVKRRQAKAHAHRVTDEAISAYVRGDYLALHRALGLKPWQFSPLPADRFALGVDQGPPLEKTTEHHGWALAAELQREIEAALTPAQRKQFALAKDDEDDDAD